MHVGMPAGSDRSSMQPRFQFVSKLLLAALLTAVCMVVLRQSSTGGGSSKADDTVRIRSHPKTSLFFYYCYHHPWFVKHQKYCL
jgi:hypothetical protein